MTASYDDDYPTCKETFATLRIFSDVVLPGTVSSLLGLQATESFAKGEMYGKQQRMRTYNAWQLSTLGHVVSRDSRRHLDWLLDRLEDRRDSLADLRLKGCEIDVTCYWVSIGQGGPIIGPEQMKRLAELNLEVWWDVYFGGDGDG